MFLIPYILLMQSYLGPEECLFTDDSTVCVMNRDAKNLQFFDIERGETVGTLPLEKIPNRMVRSGDRLFVTCGDLNGEVHEIGLQPPAILRTWRGMHSPWGVAYSPKRGKLYVGRRFHGDILVLDIASSPSGVSDYQTCLKNSIPVVREPTAMVIVPDESEIYVANLLPLDRSLGSTVSCCISILNLSDETVSTRRLPDGVNSLRDISASPDGRYVFCVHTHGNHRTITSQLFGGWTNRNGMSVIDRENPKMPICCYLVDDFQEGLTNPWSVRVSPDGQLLAFVLGGKREIVFIGMEEFIGKMNRDMTGVSPTYTFFFGVGSLSQALTRVRVPELEGLHAVAMSGTRTVAVGHFTDNLAIFDRVDAPERAKISPSSGRHYQTAPTLTSLVPRIVPLGPAPVLDARRRGEMYFFDGELSIEHWHSCVTCHPDARVDGMNWDLLNDGVQNHKNTKSMLYSHVTPPNMITGVRETGEAATRAGFVHIHFRPMDEPRYCDVDEYLKALRPVPGIRLNPDGTLTESARRGKRLFQSPKTGCSACHFGEYFTDMKLHDVGTQTDIDMHDRFDTPTLIEVFRTAPYLHDGRYLTLEELLYQGYHGDPEHRLDRLTEQEKSDLVEYLLSL